MVLGVGSERLKGVAKSAAALCSAMCLDRFHVWTDQLHDIPLSDIVEMEFDLGVVIPEEDQVRSSVREMIGCDLQQPAPAAFRRLEVSDVRNSHGDDIMSGAAPYRA
jgi:hypothetical protein